MRFRSQEAQSLPFESVFFRCAFGFDGQNQFGLRPISHLFFYIPPRPSPHSIPNILSSKPSDGLLLLSRLISAPTNGILAEALTLQSASKTPSRSPREVSLLDDLGRGGCSCAITGHNGERVCTRSRAYVDTSITIMISLEPLANKIRRVHSHGWIPPCVDDTYCRRNYLAMYVIFDILWTMFHVFHVAIGMFTNSLQHSCWLDALHHPRKSPISSSYLCTMKSISPFSTSRKSTPAW